mgnify:CR=1 FL=1
MSKKHRNKTYSGPQIPRRPEKFHSFSECVRGSKKSVYMIVRGKATLIDGKAGINWVTLGTGFLAAPNKLVTAAHVINMPETDKNTSVHVDGDKYYLIRHDDDNNFHIHWFDPLLNDSIFVYPEIDMAVINLSNGFYQEGDKIFADRNDFFRISKDFLPIGSEVGVLGYPLCKLEFKDKDFGKPLIGNVLLRVDAGVINCRYQTPQKAFVYEFTMAFNPGNSGGPIFDVKTGRVVSIVSGYMSIPINTREQIINEEGLKQMKVYKEKAFIEVLHATYSRGFATPSFVEIFKKHGI